MIFTLDLLFLNCLVATRVLQHERDTGYKLMTKMVFHSESLLGNRPTVEKSIHREYIISLPFRVIFKLLGTYFLSLIHKKKKYSLL